jgi:hypothetical protein
MSGIAPTEYAILGQSGPGTWTELARCRFMTIAEIVRLALQESFPQARFKIDLTAKEVSE